MNQEDKPLRTGKSLYIGQRIYYNRLGFTRIGSSYKTIQIETSGVIMQINMRLTHRGAHIEYNIRPMNIPKNDLGYRQWVKKNRKEISTHEERILINDRPKTRKYQSGQHIHLCWTKCNQESEPTKTSRS